MTRPYKKYGSGYFSTIKPIIIAKMIDRVTIKKIAEDLDMSFSTFANMLSRNGVRAVNIRHQHKQALKEQVK
tara:strand:- start:58 stop:273 length:216 start_codon:yes stop_codon:yes gene_type:complete